MRFPFVLLVYECLPNGSGRPWMIEWMFCLLRRLSSAGQTSRYQVTQISQKFKRGRFLLIIQTFSRKESGLEGEVFVGLRFSWDWAWLSAMENEGCNVPWACSRIFRLRAQKAKFHGCAHGFLGREHKKAKFNGCAYGFLGWEHKKQNFMVVLTDF